MKRLLVASTLLAQLVLTTAALAVTVDFTVLGSDSVDITTVSNPDGLTLNGVTFRYDDLGSGVDTASINASGIHGSTGGSLVFNFSTPVTHLNFDFSLQGVFAPVGDGLSITFKNGGNNVTDQVVPANSFTPYDPNDPTLGGDALGSLAYGGAAFDQVIMFFSPDAPFVSVANLSYDNLPEPVQPPLPGLCGIGVVETMLMSVLGLNFLRCVRRRDVY